MFEAFVLYNNERVFIQIYNSTKNNSFDNNILKTEKDIIDKYHRKIFEDLEDFNYKRMEKIYQEIDDRKKRQDEALKDIRSMLKSDNKLMSCTNGTLRHAYTKELIDIYSEKYDCDLTIKDVLAIVEEIYNERK